MRPFGDVSTKSTLRAETDSCSRLFERGLGIAKGATVKAHNTAAHYAGSTRRVRGYVHVRAFSVYLAFAIRRSDTAADTRSTTSARGRLASPFFLLFFSWLPLPRRLVDISPASKAGLAGCILSRGEPLPTSTPIPAS